MLQLLSACSPRVVSSSLHRLLQGLVLGILGCGASGCVSAIALDRAVMAYDETTTALVSKQLLLNIARARHNQPPHFTGIANISPTYNFSFPAGATPALTGAHGALLAPVFGGSVAENPTISIAPMQ